MHCAQDAHPFWMRTRSGPLLSIPYSIELNDSPALVFRQHTGRQCAEMIVDQLDGMLNLSRKYPTACSVVLHPSIVGHPFRLRALRQAFAQILEHREKLWIARPGELAGYVADLPKGVVPGSEGLE